MSDIQRQRAMIFAAMATSILLSTPATAQQWSSRELSSGACMVACEDVGFCGESSFDQQKRICTFFINPFAPEFATEQSRCPKIPLALWVLAYVDERWKLTCPAGPVDRTYGGPTHQAPGFEGGGLEDLK